MVKIPSSSPSSSPSSFSCGKGIGRTKKKPMIIGADVPRARSRRKEDVSPGKKCETVEKKNADRPKPDMTSPVVEARCTRSKVDAKFIQALKVLLTVLSGKVFAVELTALVIPALPPPPVKKLQNARRTKENVEMCDTPSGSPEA